MDNTMKSRNRMSAEELVVKEGAIEFVKNPKKKGKIFFTCGKIEFGYVSPKALELVNDTTVSDDDLLEKLQYAECQKDESSDWVPTLMVKGSSAENVVRKLGAKLLR